MNQITHDVECWKLYYIYSFIRTQRVEMYDDCRTQNTEHDLFSSSNSTDRLYITNGYILPVHLSKH